MLIEFRTRNFRSLRDEQALSLVAAKDTSLTESNTVASGVKAAPFILRTAAIYGPNAGGKSNLIKALQYMRGVIAESGSAMRPGQLFNIQPFRLDTLSINQPTEFEVTFVLDGIRHQYGFSLNTERVISEYLLVYKTSKAQQWFSRSYEPTTGQDSYEFSTGLKGQKNVWENATRPNALFLSTAVQLNSEQLRPIFDWFCNNLTIFNDENRLTPESTVNMLLQPEKKQAICDFLISADISISDISVIKRKVRVIKLNPTPDKTSIQDEEQELNEPKFHHSTPKGEAIFNLKDESEGTQCLFCLAGHILEILNKGFVLIIDELDNSLHPLLVRRLINLFQNPSINTKGAQLIFTTHDASLLDTNLLRRDQVWFVEKNQEEASKLYPLSDFSPRKNEALERGYLIGRYGGLPFFKDLHE